MTPERNLQVLQTVENVSLEDVTQVDERLLDALPARNGKQGLSEQSKQSYLAVIRQYNQFLRANNLAVGLESLKAYFDSLEGQGQKASTLNHKRFALLKVIRAQFAQDSVAKAMAVEKAFEQIPTYQTNKKITRDDVLSEDQVKALLEACPTDKTRMLAHFLYKTGCRVSEMIRIRLSDCRLVNRYVKIRIIGKGKKEREVVVPLPLYDEIREVYRGKTWLFETAGGGPMNRINVHKQIRRAGERIGLDVHPHTLRHTRATDICIRKGWSLKATSNLLGHSTTGITADMYLHDSVDFNQLFEQDII